MRSTNIVPDAISHNSCHGGCAEGAAHWLEQMQSTNLVPKCNQPQLCHCHGGCAAGAVQWLEEMQSTNLVPDAISHNSVMGVVLRGLRIGWSRCRAPNLFLMQSATTLSCGVVLRELRIGWSRCRGISYNSVMGVRIGWSRCRAPILFLMQSATTLSWGLC